MPFYFDPLNVDDPDSIDIALMGISIEKTAYTHPSHKHTKGQLLFCNKGIVEVMTNNNYFLLSPARAVWIPGMIPHKIEARATFSFQSLYFDLSHFTDLPKSVRALHVNTLLRELIHKACEFNFKYDKNSPEFRMAHVIVDEINCAPDDMRSMVIPTDKRLKKAFVYLKKNPGLHATAKNVANSICVTSRTLSRLCQKELGCGFEKWRQQIMIMESLILLEKNKSISFISDKLGYSSESAFIHCFKQWMGATPHVYKSTPGHTKSLV
jgi:AraC-like DNA-binding protein